MVPFPDFNAASTSIATSSGYLDLAAPRPDRIDLGDIALALSRLPRFTGHGAWVVTVARHSVNCYLEARARGLTHEVCRLALMHDAAEAYVGDVSRPLKDMLPGFARIEARVWRAICARFNITATAEQKAAVKEIDNLALATEARELFPMHAPFPGFPAPGFAGCYDLAGRMPDREAFLMCAGVAGVA